MPLETPAALTDMASDWSAIREKFAVEEPEPEPVEPVAQATEATQTAPESRARDEAGKFVKQEKASEKSEKPDPKAESTPTEPPAAAAAGEPVPQGTVPDLNKAPSTWKPTARAEYDKLPPAVKAEIHRREADFMNGHNQLLPDARLGKSINEIIAPYRMLIQAEGGTPESAIADLMRTAAVFRVGTPQQKTQALAQIARQFNVDVQSLVQPATTPQPNASNQTLQDPRVDQLIQQMTLERQQAQQREQQVLENTVNQWMTETKDGKLVRPYMGDVINEMSALVPQIKDANPSLPHVEVLQRAYETATWGNPEIRALLIKQQSQGTTPVRVADNQTRVREAKRAASVNVPRRASLPSPGQPGKMEETIENTARELGLIT